MLEAQEKGSNDPLMTSGAPIRNLTKDMGIIAEAAASMGLDLGVSRSAQRLFDEGSERSPGADFAALTLLIKQGRAKTPK